MSYNFALKDLMRHPKQTRAYMRNTISILTFFLTFWNLMRGFGYLLMPSSIQQYNFTIYEIITQFYFFLFILTSILAGLLLILNNHAIIQDRKRDIGIMKSIGTYPSHLYSFYLSELFILFVICFLVAWFFAFMLYLVLYLLVHPFYPIFSWVSDPSVAFISFFGLIVAIFIFNGWEIRKIGRSTYAETKSGVIKAGILGKLSAKLRSWLSKRSAAVNLAFRNILRKKHKVQQTLAIVVIANIVIFSSFFGLLIINSTGRSYISQAQSDYVIAIGNNALLETYTQGYASFTNSNIELNSEIDYLQSMNNLTRFYANLSEYLKNYGINAVDKRLFTIKNITEDPGVVLQNFVDPTTGLESQEYVLIGGNKSRTIPIQGVNFGETVQNWYYEGAMLNFEYGVAIGDTLAGEVYTNPLVQWFLYSNSATNRTYRHKVNAIVFDTFNRGNSAYLYLNTLQETLGKPNYTNLFLVDYTSLVINSGEDAVNSFIFELEDLIHTQLGEQFGLVDLSPILKHNLNSLQPVIITLLLLILMMSMVVIYNIFNFEKGRVHEDKKDYAILLAIGAKQKTLQNSIFLELGYLAILGVVLGFIGAMFFNIVFLLEESTRPSIWIPISAVGAQIIILLGLMAGISRFFQFKEQNDYLAITV